MKGRFLLPVCFQVLIFSVCELADNAKMMHTPKYSRDVTHMVKKQHRTEEKRKTIRPEVLTWVLYRVTISLTMFDQDTLWESNKIQ